MGDVQAEVLSHSWCWISTLMKVRGHLFLENTSTELQRVVISIGLEESSAATNGW